MAADLRLNVAPLLPAEQKSLDNVDVWGAVKTLLQVHERLQAVRAAENQPLLSGEQGAIKHEPIV